jgi:hypothetical protein
MGDRYARFQKLAGLTAPTEPTTAVAEPHLPRTGSDSAQFEKVVPLADAAAVAAGIIAAGRARVSGRTLSTKMPPLAEAIVAAGEKRRGKFDGFS